MSNFRTILPLKKGKIEIGFQDQIFCIGSCFTQNIGQLLGQHKFSTLLNPFGILYNPISIKNCLAQISTQKVYQKEDLFFHQDLWHSFDHHSNFSHPDIDITLNNINTSLSEARKTLKQSNRLFITFGTATIFVKKSNGQVVANCHKVPSSEFAKRRLSIEETVDALLPILKKLKAQSSNLEVIFTVSPVLHIKDGIIENQRSKATLLLAIDEILKLCSFAHYFPAYELIMDDLRDYRFFERDLVHPNDLAIQYIWEYFQATYFSEATSQLLHQVKKIVQASQHRPFHPHTTAHQKFVKKHLEKIDVLTQQFPFLQLSQERAIFQAQLSID